MAGRPRGPLGRILTLVLLGISCVYGEIRCYCNEGKCVTSSYMCKSQLGMCFTHTKVKDGVKSIVSGCADSLQEEPRMRTCVGSGIVEAAGNETQGDDGGPEIELHDADKVERQDAVSGDTDAQSDAPEVGLTCCTLDMCNYRDSNEITITIGSNPNDKGGGSVSSRRTETGSKTPKDLWFKAAVIAVPIAGGFILILLVLLAVRMLRTDSRQHKRLIQIRRERSLNKAQLYVADHFIDREKEKHLLESAPDVRCDSNPPCDTNSKLTNGHAVSDGQGNARTAAVHSHSSAKREQTHSHSSQTTSKSHRSHHHHHRDHSHQHYKQCSPKLTTHKDGHTYEQIVSPSIDTSPSEQNSGDIRTSPCSSVIMFGKSNEADMGGVGCSKLG